MEGRGATRSYCPHWTTGPRLQRPALRGDCLMDKNPGGIHVEELPDALWYEDGAWDESQIPFRPWLAIGYLLRGSVTAVVGPGGVSKSSLMLAWAVHLALGLKCHGMN